MQPTAIPSLSDPSAWFDCCDIDQSGYLDREEVISGLHQTIQHSHNNTSGVSVSADSIRGTVLAVWPAFDRDSSGTIDRSEFCGPGGMAESLRAAVEHMEESSQQRQSVSSVPVAQARALEGAFVPPSACVPSTYVPSQQQQQQYPQPSAPPSFVPVPLPPPRTGGGSNGTSSAGDGWECQICTLINSPTETRCKACGEAAPPGVAGGGLPAQGSPQTDYPMPIAVPVPQPHQAPAYPQPYQSQPYQPHQHNPTYSAPAPAQQTQPPPPQQPQMQTFRVLIPAGTQPGQRLRVETGGAEATLVAVPDRRRWRNDPNVGTQPFFDIQLPKTAPAGAAAAGYAPPPPAVPQSFATSAPPVPTPAPSMCANASTPMAAPPGAKLQVFEDRKFVSTDRVTLVLKERPFSWSGDSFSIKDQTGRSWFEVKGRAMSFREKKVLHDADGGGPVWVMKEGFDFGPDRQYVYDPRENVKGRHMFVIQPKMTFFKAKMYAAVTNRTDGRQVQVVLKGVPTQRQAGIFIGEPKQGGERIGTIQRRITGSDFFFDKQCYMLTVERGVDVALLVALTIAFDELANDDR